MVKPRMCVAFDSIILCFLLFPVLPRLPAIDIYRIQMIQNIAARLVTRTPYQQSITSTLKKLHWLPVDKRIIFKLLLITFKAQHSSSPSYLTDLLKQYHPTPNPPFKQSSITLCTKNQYYILWGQIICSCWTKPLEQSPQIHTTGTHCLQHSNLH